MKKMYLSPQAEFINVKMGEFIASGCTGSSIWRVNVLDPSSCPVVEIISTDTTSSL